MCPLWGPGASSFVGNGVAGMRQIRVTRPRSRRDVEDELADVTRRREHATSLLDFDAYQHLTEQMDDLLLELHALIPEPRPPAD